jgi:TPR repeat protein
MQKIIYTLILTIIISAYSPVALANSPKDCQKEFYAQKPSAYDTCNNFVNTGGDGDGGYPIAQKILGDMYYWGWGDVAPQNYKQAVLWYKRAATNKSAEASFALGVLYEQGKGVPTNYSSAIRWFTTAAKNGHIGAQFNLANMFSKGAGSRPNQPLASYWYERAAEQGDSEAAYNTGNRYGKGIGVQSNLGLAYTWYLIAQRTADYPEIAVTLKVLETAMPASDIPIAKQKAKNWRPKRENTKIIY